MAIAITLLSQGGSTVDASSFATASVSPGADRWLVADVASGKSTGPITQPTVSGLSLTWFTENFSQSAAGARAMSRFYAWTGAAPGSGAVTFDFVGDTQTSATWAVYEITGASTSDPFVQTVSAVPGGGSLSISATLAAFSDSNNRPLIAAEHATAEVSDPEAGYTELADQTQTAGAIGFGVAWHSSATDTTPTYSWATSTSNRIAIASEIAVGGVTGQVDGVLIDHTLVALAPQVSGLSAGAPTVIFLDSFGSAIDDPNSGTTLAGTYTLVSGTPTLDTTVTRTAAHRASLLIQQDGINLQNAYKSISTSVLVGSVYVRATTNPSQLSTMFRASGPAITPSIQISAAGETRATWGSFSQTGPTFVDGGWHLVDFRFTSSASTFTIDWQVDSVAQTQVVTSVQTPVALDRFYVGSVTTTNTAKYWLSDVVLSSTTADYPIGPHRCIQLDPNSDGTHSLGGNITNAGGGTTLLSESVDEWPPDSTTYLVQTAIGSNYAEINFADPAETVIWDVQAVLAGNAVPGVSEADTAELKVLDSGSTELSTTGLLDYSSPTVGLHRILVARPAGGWDGIKLAGAKARWGFSTDVTPAPRVTALMLEYAAPEGNTFPLIDHTLTAYAPNVSGGLIVAAGSVDHTLLPFAPTVTDSLTIQQVFPPVIDHTLTPFAFSIGDLIVQFGDYLDTYLDSYTDAGLINHTLAVFSPTSISFGTGTLEIGPLTPVDHTLSPFAPDVQADQFLFTNLIIDHTLSLFPPTPTFGNVDQVVTGVPLIDHTLTPFTMSFLGPLQPPRIDHTLTPFTPQVSGEPPVVTPEGMPALIAEIDLGQGYESVLGYLRTFTWHRGRARERDRMGAGTAQAVFDNRTGRFDRDLHPEIRPNRPARFLARVDTGISPWRMGRSGLGAGPLSGALGGGSLTLPIFTGRTEGGPMAFSQTKADSTVTWTFVDDSKRLNRDRSSTGYGTGNELTGSRINKVLDATTPTWQAGRDVDAGTRLVQAQVGTSGRFDYMLLVAESEGGAFFLGADGSAVFRDVAYAPAPDPIAYGDSPSERRYLDISIDDDDKEIFNAVTVSAPNQTDIEVTDVSSMGEFGRVDLSLSTILANGLDMQDLADFVLSGYAEPRRRIGHLGLGTRNTNWAAVLGTELLERVIARHRPPYGAMLEQELAVQGITGTVNSEFEWRVDWDLSTPLEDVRLNLLSANASSMETDFGDWYGVGLLTLFTQGNIGYIGTHSLLGLVEVPVGVQFRLQPASRPDVTPGETYEGVGYFYTDRPAQIVMGIAWYGVGGALIDENYGINQYEPSVSQWHRITVGSVAAPAGALKAEIIFLWSPTTDPTVNMYVDAVSFKQRS